MDEQRHSVDRVGHWWQDRVRVVLVAAAAAVIVTSSVPLLASPPARPGCDHTVAACDLGNNGGSGGSNVGIVHADADAVGPDGRPELNLGTFSFIGAHFGAGWGVPTGPNNSRGVGYCIQEAVPNPANGIEQLPLPNDWTAADRAHAATVMMAYGGDRVLPYAAAAVGQWDAGSGEIVDGRLWSGADGGHTRRRQMATNLAMRQFLGDMSPGLAYSGGRIYPNEATMTGGGPARGSFDAAYDVSRQMADWARGAAPVGAVSMTLTWLTPGNARPTAPGTYRLRLAVTDSTGKGLRDMPVLQWRDAGDPSRPDRSSLNATANVVNFSFGSSFQAAKDAGWPTWEYGGLLAGDGRFMVGPGGGQNEWSAGTTTTAGTIEFDVTITSAQWRVGFHVQAPSQTPRLFGGTASQNNVTWGSEPISTDASDEQMVGSIRIDKTSDANLPVAGTVLELRDRSGQTITSATVPPTGSVQWDGVPASALPVTVHETVAAPGHRPPDPSVALARFDTLSASPATPSTAAIANQVLRGYFRLNKTSTDATLSPAGATFDLRDGNGASLNAYSPTGGVVPASGVVDWGGFVLAQHPGPYSLYELTAPPAFVQPDPSRPVLTEPVVSTDPAVPTTRTASNTPLAERLQIEKRISQPNAAQDLSGFAFSVTRVADAQLIGVATTRWDGITPEIVLVAGLYEVCEVAMPPWAEASSEGPGCLRTVVSAGEPTTATFTYVNSVRSFEASTLVSTPVAAVGDVLTDDVWIRDSVAGRQLRLHMSGYSSAAAAQAGDVVCDASTSEVTSSTTFTAMGGEQIVGVDFTVPAAAAGRALWFAGVIVDVATNVVVATLPCGDPNERVLVPTIETWAPAGLQPGGTAHDRYRVEGLPGETLPSGWSASARFELFADDDTCDESTARSLGVVEEAVAGNGTFETQERVQVEPGAAHHFVEALTVSVDWPRRPDGSWSLRRGGVTDDVEQIGRTFGGARCVREESFVVPVLTSAASTPFFVGGDVGDVVVVEGLGDVLDAGTSSVRLVGGLYRHAATTSLAERTCASDNLVTPIDVAVGGDGPVVVPPIAASSIAPGWSYSFAWVLHVERQRTGGFGVESFESPQHGCADRSQTLDAPALTTVVRIPILVGDAAAVDDVAVTGLSELPAGYRARVVGGLYRHAPTTPLNSRSCTTENVLTPVDMEVTSSGTYTTPGERGWSAGDSVSYDLALVIERVDGGVTVEQWSTTPHGCTLAAETAWAPVITTVARDPILSGTADAVDLVTVTGIGPTAPPDVELRVVGGLYRHDATTPLTARTCDGSNRVDVVEMAITGDGTFPTPGERWTPGASYSWDVQLAAVLRRGGVVIGEVRTAPHGCTLAAETAWAPELTTDAVHEAPVLGDVQQDRIMVSAMPPTLPDGWTARIVGGLHEFAAATPLPGRVCDDTNLRAPIDLPIRGNGSFVTPGEAWRVGYAYSYQERIELHRPGQPALVLDVHGCGEPTQSFVTTRRPSGGRGDRGLPNAGSTPLVLVVVAGALVVTGAGLLNVRRRRRS